MNELKKITIIFLRIQAVCFILMGLMQWGIIAAMILVDSLREAVPSQLESFEFMLLFGAFYFLVGFILYARSRSLAKHFRRGSRNRELSPDLTWLIFDRQAVAELGSQPVIMRAA